MTVQELIKGLSDDQKNELLRVLQEERIEREVEELNKRIKEEARAAKKAWLAEEETRKRLHEKTAQKNRKQFLIDAKKEFALEKKHDKVLMRLDNQFDFQSLEVFVTDIDQEFAVPWMEFILQSLRGRGLEWSQGYFKDIFYNHHERRTEEITQEQQQVISKGDPKILFFDSVFKLAKSKQDKYHKLHDLCLRYWIPAVVPDLFVRLPVASAGSTSRLFFGVYCYGIKIYKKDIILPSVSNIVGDRPGNNMPINIFLADYYRDRERLRVSHTRRNAHRKI